MQGLPQWCAPLFCLPRRAVRVEAPAGEGGAAPAGEQPIVHQQRLQCRLRGQLCSTTTVCQGVPRDFGPRPGLGAVEEAPQQPPPAPAQQAAGSAAQEQPSSSTRGRDASMPALVFQRSTRRPQAG
jgi:hypothetical protein